MAVVDGVEVLVDRQDGLDGVLVGDAPDEVGGRLGLALAGVGARQADLSQRDGHHADGARGLLAVGVALHAPALAHEGRLGVFEVAGELHYLVGRYLGDGRGPLGGLGHLVVARAQDIVLVGELFALGRRRHGLLVPAHAMRAQERLVGFTVLDELVDQSRAQGRVGARAYGQPLVGMRAGGLVQAVVDVDDLAPARLHTLAHLRELPTLVGAAHTRLGRAVAEHDDQVRVPGRLAKRRGVDVVVGRKGRGLLAERLVDLRLGVYVGAAPVHVGHDHLQHVRGVVGALVHETAEQAEQPVVGRLARRAVHARRVVDEDGLRAVVLVDLLQLVVDGLDRLVPADALELALAALSRALHGVQQAVRVVHPAAQAASAQAGARLEVVVAYVVGLHVGDLAVAHVPLEDAIAPAVDVALAPGGLLLACRLVRALGKDVARCGERAACGSDSGESTGGFDERASAHLRIRHEIPSLSFSRRLSSKGAETKCPRLEKYADALRCVSHEICEFAGQSITFFRFRAFSPNFHSFSRLLSCAL